MSITPDDWFDRFFGNFPFVRRGHRSYFDDTNPMLTTINFSPVGSSEKSHIRCEGLRK